MHAIRPYSVDMRSLSVTSASACSLAFAFLLPACQGAVQIRGLDNTPSGKARTTSADDASTAKRDAPRSGARAGGKAPTPAEQALAKAEARSVVKRFPDLGPNDALVLAKVRTAFEKADASMYVRTKLSGERTNKDGFWFSPVRQGYGGTYAGQLKGYTGWAEGKKKFGGAANYGFAVAGERTGALVVGTYDDYPWYAPAGTPGLVWNVVDAEHAICAFVALDGHRFQGRCSQLEDGAGDPAAWPTLPALGLVDPHAIEETVKAGGLADKTGADVKASNAKWEACRDRVWAPSKRELDAIDAADIRADVRARRRDQVFDRYGDAAYTQCRGLMDAFEKLVVGIADKREKEHAALLEVTKKAAAAKVR